jgi:hypothetical protein
MPFLGILDGKLASITVTVFFFQKRAKSRHPREHPPPLPAHAQITLQFVDIWVWELFTLLLRLNCELFTEGISSPCRSSL